MRVTAAARTHVGLVKQRNEDNFHVGAQLFAIADGLGGHPAGDVASATVIEALRPYDKHVNQDELLDTLGHGVAGANAAVQRRIAVDATLAGMGSTLVALLIGGSAAVLANLGDSRAYRLRGDKFERLTDDHNLGRLLSDPAMAERLTRFIDGRPDGRSPDLTLVDLQPRDRLLLCSDGLSSPVPQSAIRDALAAEAGPDAVAGRLVALALDRGAPDNVTVVVVQIEDGS